MNLSVCPPQLSFLSRYSAAYRVPHKQPQRGHCQDGELRHPCLPPLRQPHAVHHLEPQGACTCKTTAPSCVCPSIQAVKHTQHGAFVYDGFPCA